MTIADILMIVDRRGDGHPLPGTPPCSTLSRRASHSVPCLFAEAEYGAPHQSGMTDGLFPFSNCSDCGPW